MTDTTDIDLTHEQLADTMFELLGATPDDTERAALTELIKEGGLDAVGVMTPRGEIPSVTVRTWTYGRSHRAFIGAHDQFFPAHRIDSGRPVLNGNYTVVSIGRHRDVLMRNIDIQVLFGATWKLGS